MKSRDFLVLGSVDGNDPLAGMCTELSNVFSTSDTHFPLSADALDSSYRQCCSSMVRFPLLQAEVMATCHYRRAVLEIPQGKEKSSFLLLQPLK